MLCLLLWNSILSTKFGCFYYICENMSASNWNKIVGTKILKGDECLYDKSGSSVDICRNPNVTWEYPIIEHSTSLKMLKWPHSEKEPETLHQLRLRIDNQSKKEKNKDMLFNQTIKTLQPSWFYNSRYV